LPKSTTPHSTPLTPSETLALYLVNTSPFLTKSHLSPNHAITIVVSFVCIRPCLHFKTASIIATSVDHSMLDYCNPFSHNLPKSQITPLQHIQNCLARAVVKTPNPTRAVD